MAKCHFQWSLDMQWNLPYPCGLVLVYHALSTCHAHRPTQVELPMPLEGGASIYLGSPDNV